MMNVISQQEVTVVELGQRYESLDDDTLEELGGLLLTKAATADPPLMVLDLSRTTYIGSTFIELLVRAWKRLKERGGAMALCGVRPFCAEVLHTTQLDAIWGCYSSRDQAVRALEERLKDAR